ncbi:MAG: MBG domain-containing protein, partial [Candidatus Cloacimonetes bacterium]|nr:MBG domain-containing protein [Candidatus Cloacimonadota bacterium]
YTVGTLTIAKANATVTANSDTKTYNGTSQTITSYTVSGLLNAENASALDTITGASASGTNVGTYRTTLSGSDNNYELSFANGALTITKANATITANSDTKTYNGLNQSVTGFSATGLVNNETISVLSGVSTTGGSGKNVGEYTLVASGVDGNYNLTFVDGALTITKANATVTANSDTKTYNGTSQSITGYTVSGLVNGENASVLDSVTLSGSGTNVGTYTISGTGSDNNYNLSFANGALTITKANATVTANSDTKTYNGTSQSITGYTVSGLLNGENASVLDSVTLSGSGTNVGTYTISGTGSDNNYNLSFANGTLTITKASLTVTANNASKTHDGLAYSGGNGVSYSGFVNNETASVLSGNLSYGGDSQNAINAGSYVITASGLDSGNYTLSYVNGTLTITTASVVTPTQDPTPIITQIINGTAITPPVIPTFTPPTPPAQAPQQFNVGGARVQLASVPSGDTPSQLVGTQEARAMIQGGEVGELRIPLGQNSGIQLVNGGVHLPEGLEQQFFMAQR